MSALETGEKASHRWIAPTGRGGKDVGTEREEREGGREGREESGGRRREKKGREESGGRDEAEREENGNILYTRSERTNVIILYMYI